MLADRVPPWVKVAVVSAAGLLVSMQFTFIVPLIGELPALLDVSVEDASWLLTVTLVCGAVATPIIARMADMHGKRLMMQTALTVMVLGSVVCALDIGFTAMLIGRAMQGFGSALIAVGISVLRDEIPRERIGTSIAFMSATIGIGSSFGLPFAGVIYEHISFAALFWITALIGTALIGAIWLFIAESPVRTRGRFDLVGAVVFAIAIIALLLPLSKGIEWGWTSPAVLSLLAASVVAFALWVPLQLRMSQPMVDIRIVRQRSVLATNAASLMLGFAMFANMLVTAQILQTPTVSDIGLGLDAAATGLAMIPSGLAMAFMAPLTGRLLNRYGARLALIIGSGLMGFSYIGRIFLSDTLAQVIIGAVVVGVGTAIAFAAMPTLIMTSVPITQTASANGVNALVRSVGSATASTVCAVIIVALGTHTGQGEVLTTRAGIVTILLVASSVSLLAAGLSLMIPRRTREEIPESDSAGSSTARELIAHGRLMFGDGDTEPPSAVVSILTLSGEQITWYGTDALGNYSVALPGPGRYIVAIDANGWSPTTHIVDYTDDARHDLFVDQACALMLSGRVTVHGRPCPEGRWSVLSAKGTVAQSGACDARGDYRIPLPPPGTYTLVASDLDSGRTASRTIVVGVESLWVDLDVGGSETLSELPER